jgi:hypothetical protein
MRILNVTTQMQFIKNLITFGYIKRIFNIILTFFMNRQDASHVKDLALDGQMNSVGNTLLDSSSKPSELC